ncbi:hypothetical protein Hdeb2414_s0728g00940221 [Helianthus debilis subsp. tardiflorus]
MITNTSYILNNKMQIYSTQMTIICNGKTNLLVKNVEVDIQQVPYSKHGCEL